MTLQVACPHCQSPLLVPENCGGQTTRCPKCTQPFLIPGQPAPPPVATILQPASAASANEANEPSEAELKQAQQRYEELLAENLALQLELSKLLRRRVWLTREVNWLERFQWGRQRLDQSIGRIGGFFVAIALAPAAMIVLLSLVGPSAFTYFALASLAMIAAALAYVPFSYYPDDETLARLIPRRSERLAEATAEHERHARVESAQRQKLIAAETEFQRIKAAVTSKLAWLRSCQWQGMNAKTLVKFLEQVFAEHGYTVEPTGKRGQVGIDLVVSRGGVRTAIQVKGIQVHAVDNPVVQQTHAGQGSYQCQRSAVITNAQFLPSARQLADKLGVQLIDASGIPDLIEGRMSV